MAGSSIRPWRRVHRRGPPSRDAFQPRAPGSSAVRTCGMRLYQRKQRFPHRRKETPQTGSARGHPGKYEIPSSETLLQKSQSQPDKRRRILRKSSGAPELPILASPGHGWLVPTHECLTPRILAQPLPQSSALWKRRMAIVSRLTAMPAMAAICGHRISIPRLSDRSAQHDQKIAQRDCITKILHPLRHGAYRESESEKLTDGMMKKKEVTMACCCVDETVEINNPTPSMQRRNRIDPVSKTTMWPRNGIWNQSVPTAAINETSKRPIRKNGSVLPRMNSAGRMALP